VGGLVVERFELIGGIHALEQRRYKSGEPIQGFWSVKLRTDDGIRYRWRTPESSSARKPVYLSIPAVTGASVGARTPEQIDGWLAARDTSLSEDHLREIDSLLLQT